MAIKVRRGRLYPPVDLAHAQRMGLEEIEWDRIVDRLGRPPNHFECEIFATLWSEEVSDKSSTELLKTIDLKHEKARSVPGSPISLFPLGNGQYLSLRIVNNNKQCAIDPFYGAQTAIDESIEELSAVGATPIGLLNMLRFGNFDLIRNKRLFQGVVDGISVFGNRYGVPVVGGELYFHERYNSGPMVNSGVVAVTTNDNALQINEVPFQSPVLYVGAKTGRDGLLEQRNEQEDLLDGEVMKRELIKMSDPLLSNRLVNACSEAIEKGLLTEVVAIGKGGLAVSAFDLSKRINRPILVDIDRIPLRRQGYEPLDIILSESSERLLMITDRNKHRDLNKILYKWDLESVKIGEVNDSDGIEFYWNHYLAADIPFQFAVEGSVQKTYEVVQFPPMLKRSANLEDDANKIRKKKRKVVDEWSLIREVALAKAQEEEDRELDCPKNLDDVWLDLLANPNLCSRSPMYTMFDQVVGANTLQRPGGDSAILRLRRQANSEELNGAEPKPESAIAVTLDSNSLYVMMEPYLGTVQTIAEGMRNLAAVGARPLALAACMNFGNPEEYRDVCDMSESIRGLGDASKLWDIPVLSRQMCLGNGKEGSPSMPTPAILMAGLIDDIDKTCGIGFRDKGDLIFLIGLTKNEIYCTEYSSYTHKYVNKLVPDIEFEVEKKYCDFVVSLIQQKLINSAHDLSGGGLAIALTECCMVRSRPIGATFTIDNQEFESPHGLIPLRADAALFGESSARFLLSCAPSKEAAFREACEENGILISGIGKVGGRDIVINGAGAAELPLSTTYKLWIHRLESLLGVGGKETVGFGAT